MKKIVIGFLGLLLCSGFSYEISRTFNFGYITHLDLTDKQQSGIQTVKESAKTKKMELLMEREEVKTLLYSEFEELNPDKKLIFELIENYYELDKDLELVRLDVYFQVKSILTEAQFKKLLENQDTGRTRQEFSKEKNTNTINMRRIVDGKEVESRTYQLKDKNEDD